MERVKLEPPFSLRKLDAICAAMRDRYWADARDTMEWLLITNSAEGMAQAIRAAWHASDLPLRDWAEDIIGVVAFTNEASSFLGLEVELDTRLSTRIVQQAPLSGSRLDELAVHLRFGVPAVFRQMCLCAPGLQLDGAGMLCCPWYLLAPLQREHRRLEILSQACPNDDAPVKMQRQLQKLAMEFAEDGLGNTFILGSDQSLYFHDFPECDGFQRCRVTAEEFVRAYFERPEMVFDNDLLIGQ